MPAAERQQETGQLLQLLVQGRHAGLDGHHVVGVPTGDGLRGVALRVQGADRDDRPARSVNAFSSSRTAGISVDFASTAT
jgi:hypothetical protein